MHPKFTNKNRTFTNKSKQTQPSSQNSTISRSYTQIQSSQLINTVLFKQLHDASDKLFNQITAECTKRIKSIQKSTAEALGSISLLKKSLKSLYLSSNFTVKNLQELKEFSNKASLYYKIHTEEFDIVIDQSVKELGVVLEFPNIGTYVKKVEVSEMIENKVKIVKWGIVNNRDVNVLPDWIISQIEAGVANGQLEIQIFKKNQLVSMADLRAMKYYGVLNGNRLPPQDLRRIG